MVARECYARRMIVATDCEAGRGHDTVCEGFFLCHVWKFVLIARILEVSLLGVGTVLILERDS